MHPPHPELHISLLIVCFAEWKKPHACRSLIINIMDSPAQAFSCGKSPSGRFQKLHTNEGEALCHERGVRLVCLQVDAF